MPDAHKKNDVRNNKFKKNLFDGDADDTEDADDRYAAHIAGAGSKDDPYDDAWQSVECNSNFSELRAAAPGFYFARMFRPT